MYKRQASTPEYLCSVFIAAFSRVVRLTETLFPEVIRLFEKLVDSTFKILEKIIDNANVIGAISTFIGLYFIHQQRREVREMRARERALDRTN
jgi:hypothetical protein